VKLHLDDPLDAIAVHCWNGTWGLIAPGLFSAQNLINNAYGTVPGTTDMRLHYGCFLGGDGNLLGAQLVDVLWIFGALAVPALGSEGLGLKHGGTGSM
jgi:Amt family ammonium transporter